METDVGIQVRDEVIWKDKMVVEVLRGQTVRIYFESVADRHANGLDGVGEKEESYDGEFVPEEEAAWARLWWRVKGTYGVLFWDISS